MEKERPMSPEQKGEPSKPELEKAKSWNPESESFWELSSIDPEAEKAERSDKIEVESINRSTWNPEEIKQIAREYARERGLDEEDITSEISCVLAMKDDTDQAKSILRGVLPGYKNGLVYEARNLLKEGGDREEIWQRIKMGFKIDGKLAGIEKHFKDEAEFEEFKKNKDKE